METIYENVEVSEYVLITKVGEIVEDKFIVVNNTHKPLQSKDVFLKLINKYKDMGFVMMEMHYGGKCLTAAMVIDVKML